MLAPRLTFVCSSGKGDVSVIKISPLMPIEISKVDGGKHAEFFDHSNIVRLHCAPRDLILMLKVNIRGDLSRVLVCRISNC